MFQLAGPVAKEARKIIGSCDNDAFFLKCSEAVNLLGNCADLEGWKGWLDLCIANSACELTLPREVGTVLAVTIGGRPALGHDQLYNFHLNGPGDCGVPCDYSWVDRGAWHATYRDLTVATKLVAYVGSEEDSGKSLIVYGYDSAGNRLKRTVSGQLRDGYQVPTVYGYAMPDVDAPLVGRIVGVEKADTLLPVRLSTIDNDGVSGLLLGVYEPDERLPQYRRIKLSRATSWARIFYRKSRPQITSMYDRIPLVSETAFFSALRSIKKRLDSDHAGAIEWEADAKRLEIEAQQTLEAPLLRPPQVSDRTRMLDGADYEIR
jgi:hypothetical protein